MNVFSEFLPGSAAPGSHRRYEAVFAEGGVSGQRLAAAARQARQQVAANSAQERAIRDVSASVAAPILVSYVLWLLLDAHARGLRRLYFLSRDAEVLLELADILLPRLGFTIERRYLYASRRAWYGTEGDWPWDFEQDLTVNLVLDRLSIRRDAVASDLTALGYDRFDTILKWGERVRLRDYLLASGRLDAGGRRRMLQDYLDQEDVFDGVPKAVVDLGGHGTQHDLLCDMLKKKKKSLCSLYLFWGHGCDWSWKSWRHCYHHDSTRAEPLPYVFNFVPMEIFCSASHGTLTGFRQSGDRVEPVLAAARSEVLDAWGLPLLRETLRVFARSLDLNGVSQRDIDPVRNPSFRLMIERLFTTFWAKPTPEEARAWSRFPWEIGEGRETHIARRYTFEDIPLVKRRNLEKRGVPWVGGSLALTPLPLAILLRGGVRVMRLVEQGRRTARTLRDAWSNGDVSETAETGRGRIRSGDGRRARPDADRRAAHGARPTRSSRLGTE
jgi:hypothetical protein